MSSSPATAMLMMASSTLASQASRAWVVPLFWNPFQLLLLVLVPFLENYKMFDAQAYLLLVNCVVVLLSK